MRIPRTKKSDALYTLTFGFLGANSRNAVIGNNIFTAYPQNKNSFAHAIRNQPVAAPLLHILDNISGSAAYFLKPTLVLKLWVCVGWYKYHEPYNPSLVKYIYINKFFDYAGGESISKFCVFYYALVDILEIFPHSYQDFWDPESNACPFRLPTSLTQHSFLANHSIGLHFGSFQTAWAWSRIYCYEGLGVGS